MTDFEYEIHEVLVELEKTLISKNKDYGNSFDSQMDEFGIVAGVIRITDKYNRLKQLSKPNHEQQVNDEALIDTVKDLCGYSSLLYRWLKNQENKP